MDLFACFEHGLDIHMCSKVLCVRVLASLGLFDESVLLKENKAKRKLNLMAIAMKNYSNHFSMEQILYQFSIYS